MIYTDFLGEKISLLGFGAMRLPLNEDNTIDKKQTQEMVNYAMEQGVNYFDTAWPYHYGMSEIVIGECLKKYPRDSFYLANKYPGHQPAEKYDPKGVFEAQLKKCGVDYFDFYLLHNISEFSFDVYTDREIGILEYFVEQKKQGKIKHLGFSTHADTKTFVKIMEAFGDEMEFCQIQMNFVDWKLQDAEFKYNYLKERNIPAIVMEPIRGGALKDVAKDSFRWIMDYDGIMTILSGMSNMSQLEENIQTFDSLKPLDEEERKALKLKADSMVDMVPCTECNYCQGCPVGLDIPKFMSLINIARSGIELSVSMALESLPETELPAACINCGACIEKCPQKIDIPERIKELDERWRKMKKWVDICREREEIAKKMKEQSK